MSSFLHFVAGLSTSSNARQAELKMRARENAVLMPSSTHICPANWHGIQAIGCPITKLIEPVTALDDMPEISQRRILGKAARRRH